MRTARLSASVAAFTDITERKQAEDELKRARVELETARQGADRGTCGHHRRASGGDRRAEADGGRARQTGGRRGSTAEAIVVTDKRGIIQYVNPAFEQVTGYRPGGGDRQGCPSLRQRPA